MPARITPLVNNEYYHVFNRGINKRPIFLNKRDYERAFDVLQYYSFATIKLRFSKFLQLTKEVRQQFWNSMIKEKQRLVTIICFCLMPNHFHFLLRQEKENGISRYMSNFQNSYTRFFTTKRRGIGPILQGQFKAVRVEDENQLLHLSRYIHLNPYTSFVVKELKDLVVYPWSSFPEYLGKTSTTIRDKQVILSHFKDAGDYQKFLFDQADYQRELNQIKHLRLEE